jgi:hypothetical protein
VSQQCRGWQEAWSKRAFSGFFPDKPEKKQSSLDSRRCTQYSRKVAGKSKKKQQANRERRFNLVPGSPESFEGY